MKFILIVFFVSIGTCKSLAQSLEISRFETLSFVGHHSNKAIFKDDFKYLYTWNELVSTKFEFLDSGKLPFFPNKFVGAVEISDLGRRYIETYKPPLKIIIETPAKAYIHEVNHVPSGISTNFEQLKVYIGNKTDNPDVRESLPIYELDLVSGQLQVLPIKGISPFVVGDFLFYADYPRLNQFDLVYDIYRVKIGDWGNPEKVFEDNYMDTWKVSSDGMYLLAEVIESGYRPQKVIYNLRTGKYEPIMEEGLPSAVFYSKAKQTFCFYDIGLYSDGKRRFVYVDMPKVFSFTPTWAMRFGDTIITPYLLDEATEEELARLNKNELRLLRNAIFARRGWRFQDENLTAFFNQFDWYQEQMRRVKSNDSIVLTNSDKYRSQLILKLEEKK